MSAITATLIAETARQRLGWAASELPRLQAMIPSALKGLAVRVARREDYEALRTEIDVICTAGIITLNDASILVEVLLETGELLLDGRVAKSAPSYQGLTLKMPADVYR